MCHVGWIAASLPFSRRHLSNFIFSQILKFINSLFLDSIPLDSMTMSFITRSHIVKKEFNGNLLCDSRFVVRFNLAYKMIHLHKFYHFDSRDMRLIQAR